MAINKLTDGGIRKIKPGAAPAKHFDGHGLYLYITPAGSRLWRMAYRADGRAQTETFGAYPLVTLAQAREKRDAVRQALATGAPVRAPKVQPSITLASACQAYWQGRGNVSAGYRADALSALDRHVYPLLGAMPLASLGRAEVLDALNRMDAAGLHVYVRRTRMWLSQVFDWAVEQGHCAANPCASIRPTKAFGARPVVSFPALELRDVPAFWQRLALEHEIQSAMACRLLAYTWVRTAELRGMRWSEIDGDTWRVPAARMKRNRDHLVPLSDPAIAIIDKMRLRSRGSDYVFPNDRRLDRPMSENAILYLIGRMGYGGRMTGHGWRTVASTWANERGYSADAVEKQLAHAPDDKVRAVYNRADLMPERRVMLREYAQWLGGG